MKAIKFFVTTLLVAMMPMLMVSCEGGEEPTNNNPGSGTSGPTITASIVGNWELVEVIKKNNEGAILETNKIGGEYWDFTADVLTVGDMEYGYTLANAKLTTDYAKIYKADYFSVRVLTEAELKLSATYSEEDKVGDREITNTLKFKRLAE